MLRIQGNVNHQSCVALAALHGLVTSKFEPEVKYVEEIERKYEETSRHSTYHDR